ncbi:type 4a pilus biogenesis protein PilO [Vibrio maerlii]|uniref:type 4a pilus biogenesis protein PilO n=1 Tax=Vibrio maerlii TaxID=2231648 RepID=UPI000E3EDF67|nr:type 4a pilus biogenesis protein PilO [Vibrio maerlii]
MVDLQELDLDEITEWPLVAQSILVVLLVLVIQGVGAWFYLKPQVAGLEALKQKEGTLKSTIITKTNQVAALPKLQAQLDELNSRYDLLLKQLPMEKELASMLASVNEHGIENNLTFTRIDWGDKQEQDFLYRLPLNIELTGDYYNIGDFSEAIARSPRIINLDDASWHRVSQESSSLHFHVKAYTYQFKPEAESD